MKASSEKVKHCFLPHLLGACKNDSHFFLTLSFLVSDANDIDTKEEGEEKDEDALSFPIHL